MYGMPDFSNVNAATRPHGPAPAITTGRVMLNGCLYLCRLSSLLTIIFICVGYEMRVCVVLSTPFARLPIASFKLSAIGKLHPSSRASTPA